MSREERRELVNRVKEGCSPLFLACKRGNVEIVQYLLDECGADVEQKGMYEVPDDRSIHHVTPLWCAAVAGKLEVVKALVRRGANVNSVSDTGSTPVRSACFMTHLDIVEFLVQSGADILKANYNGGTCLINSVQSVPLCSFLLRHGAEVNVQDIQMKTALHYAIQEHRFETTKLLLEHGANPYIRSRYGDDALQTACLKVATQIFDYLINNFEYSDERIAEAYELLGSTFLDEHFDLQTALVYWKKAMEIRMKDPNNPIPKKNLVPPKGAYRGMTEFNTPAQLDDLSLDLDAMRIQSLLICERILGPSHKDMIFRLMYRGAAYADSLQYQRCIDLWRYALQLRIEKDTLLHSESCFAAQALVRLLLDLQEKRTSGVMREELRYEDVVGTIELLVSQVSSTIEALKIRPVFKRQQENFDKILKVRNIEIETCCGIILILLPYLVLFPSFSTQQVLTHLFYVLNTIHKSPAQEEEIRALAAIVDRKNPRTSSGDSLLHLVVSKANTMKTNSIMEEPHTIIFPDAGVAELLLEAGADVDATNNADCTPLHLACTRSNYQEKVVRTLLSRGAHIDRRSASGNQPQVLLSSISECTINPMQFVSLKCLSARVISTLR